MVFEFCLFTWFLLKLPMCRPSFALENSDERRKKQASEGYHSTRGEGGIGTVVSSDVYTAWECFVCTLVFLGSHFWPQCLLSREEFLPLHVGLAWLLTMVITIHIHTYTETHMN